MFSIGLLIILGIIIIIAVVIIILAVGATGNTKRAGEETLKEGGEIMIKNIYIYLVLFATLMMTIGGSVSAFMEVADLVSPPPYYQSYEDYSEWQLNKNEYEGSNDENISRPSESEIRERYDAMVAQERQREVSRAKNSLIKSFGWILIPLGIFIYFQRNMVKNKD